MIIHHGEPCISCEHYSPDTREDNHWVCDFDHDTCPHIEELHNAFGYKKKIDAEVLDKIRGEIIKYEGDCRLSVDEYPSCKQCTDNTFETIYAILDKYKASPTGAESEVEE